MPKLRVHRAELSSPASAPKLRVHRAELTGAVPPKLRVHRAELTGAPAVVVLPFADRTVETGATVALTAYLQSFLTADSYAWTQTDGPTVALSGVGAVRSFVAPSDAAGTSVQFSVTATLNGVTSSAVLATTAVLPALEWRATVDGWVPGRTYLL